MRRKISKEDLEILRIVKEHFRILVDDSAPAPETHFLCLEFCGKHFSVRIPFEWRQGYPPTPRMNLTESSEDFIKLMEWLKR